MNDWVVYEPRPGVTTPDALSYAEYIYLLNEARERGVRVVRRPGTRPANEPAAWQPILDRVRVPTTR